MIAILLGGLFYYFFHGYNRMSIFIMIGLFLAYGLSYLGLLLASKAITKEELVDISNMMNPGKLGHYAMDELRKKSD